MGWFCWLGELDDGIMYNWFVGSAILLAALLQLYNL